MNINQQSDAALLATYLDRSTLDANRNEAFSAIVDRHGNMVLRTCFQLGQGNLSMAEDAMQGTFIILAEQAGRIRNREALPAWLYAVARKVVARAIQTETRRRKREQIAMENYNAEAVRPGVA